MRVENEKRYINRTIFPWIFSALKRWSVVVLILSELNFLGFISYALYISEIIIEEQSAIILNKREENARL